MGSVTLAILASLTMSQDTVAMTGPACGTCLIVLEPIVRLGSLADPSSALARSRVARDGRGRYFVGPVVGGGEIMVYDSTGAFVATVGRSGRGPKEFHLIFDLQVGPGDTLHVLHGDRRTLVTHDLEFARTHRIGIGGRVGRARILDDDLMVVLAHIPTRAAAGFPLHIIRGDSIARSFGTTDTTHHGFPERDVFRPFTVGKHGVWIGRMNAYIFEEWTLDGQLRRALQRDPEWFVEWGADIRYSSKVTFVEELPSGELLTISGVATQDYLRTRPALGRPPVSKRGQETPVPPLAELNRNYATRIEGIDPARGVVIATREVAAHIRGLVAGPERGLVYSLEAELSGLTVVAIWRIRIQGPTR